MFKILIGSKVEKLYRQIEEQDKSIMDLNKIIQDLRDSEKEECKQGVYCSNCKHSFQLEIQSFVLDMVHINVI